MLYEVITKKAGSEKIFLEKISGTKKNRPEFAITSVP